ncbi:glycosyltransferase [Acidocella sp.]|uniref:glycosyltransferase n=1 Tax=Acidocella sp. TaxID=50710 RepID=UPI002602797E|nr:glycosyltransferase [Acidocella sp.]MDD2795312.1 glycosyltransferase [Acidocella sp.]
MEMLFTRDFTGFSGGHLKHHDYLRHTVASGLAAPVLYQTPGSAGVPGNPFAHCGVPQITTLRPFPAYFLAGMDWSLLDDAGIAPGAAPVINLIQGLRHAEPGTPLFAYLARPALRICVSQQVADAIAPFANGPVHTIRNGIEITPPPPRPLTAPARIFIGGAKNPEMAHEIAALLQGETELDLLTTMCPREEFIARLAAASICVLLPLRAEGFFLPPLEAMALGRAIVVPDCTGNRGFCLPGETCLMPAYNAAALADAARALARNPAQRAALAESGTKMTANHTLAGERAAYITLLRQFLNAA